MTPERNPPAEEPKPVWFRPKTTVWRERKGIGVLQGPNSLKAIPLGREICGYTGWMAKGYANVYYGRPRDPIHPGDIFGAPARKARNKE